MDDDGRAAAPGMAQPGRRPRILWANVYCLLDVSSGASISVREILRQLRAVGWDVSILGATNFDHPRGTAGLKGYWDQVAARPGKVTTVADGGLTHRLYGTANTRRTQMTSQEEGAWYTLYLQALEQDRPDVVFYYGGQPFDQMIAIEARRRGIPVAFYLANGNYRTKHWCRDLDLVLTDTEATAALYRDRLGLDPVPVGKFIDPDRFVAAEHSRERVLFVNPKPEKGAVWVAALALWLERRRPDIVFEIVESRGTWARIISTVTEARGETRTALHNVVLTPSTDDMRPAYGRARLVLAPSLWWESGGRVLAEAMLNGIPAITTDRGGTLEMVQEGGIRIRLPEKYHRAPYTLLPPEEEVEQIAELLETFFDDAALYERLCASARAVGRRHHDIAVNTRRVVDALSRSIAERRPV